MQLKFSRTSCWKKNYDGEIDTMDIVVLNGILQGLREFMSEPVLNGDYYSKSSLVAIF